MGAGASMTAEKSDTGSNVKVVGLLAMGLTLIMIGLGLLPSPYANGFAGHWAAFPIASIFGGIVLAVVGLLALSKGHLYWGSAFTSYGAFFLVWASTLTSYNSLGGGPFAGVFSYGLAGFTFVFLLMTLTYLVSSLKHGWMAFFLFLFFFVSFVLWLSEYWTIGAGNSVSKGMEWATGGLTILTGLLAWYMATAHLTNTTYGKKFLPG